MLVVAFGDVVLHNGFTLMPPGTFAALVAIVLGFLLHEFVVARQRMDVLDRQAVQLKSAGARLEQSLAAAAAFNARLNQSEARYKGLVDAQGDAIFRRAPDSRLTYGNDAFFKLFGLNPQRAIGQPFAPELHPSSRAPLFGVFAGLETGRARVRYDQHVRTAYGWRWLAWEDYAVRDAQGRLVEVQSVGRDITERKALEEAIVEARDKAEAGSRAKSGFLATMSHEIRTPMNGVLGMARLLQETDLRPEQRTYVEAIRESGETLLTLIGDILDFSKIEAGSFTPEDDEVDLRPLIEGVVELCCPRAHDKSIELVAVVAPDVPRRDPHRRPAPAPGADQPRQQRGEVHREAGGVAVDVLCGRGRSVASCGSTCATPVSACRRKSARKSSANSCRPIRAMRAASAARASVLPSRRSWSKRWAVKSPSTRPRAAAACSGSPSPRSSSRRRRRCRSRRSAGLQIAIVTRNAILREGLTVQVRSAGGSVMEIAEDFGPRPDVMLVDAGTDAEPNPPSARRPRRADAGAADADRAHAASGNARASPAIW